MAAQPTEKSPLKKMCQKGRGHTGKRRELKFVGLPTAHWCEESSGCHRYEVPMKTCSKFHKG